MDPSLAFLSLLFLNLVALEVMLYIAGHAFMRLTRKVAIFAIAIVVIVVIEYGRYLVAMWIVSLVPGPSPGGLAFARLRLWFISLLPLVAFLAIVIAAASPTSIAACDRCNQWTVPFGGSIWKRRNLSCLPCLLRKYPLGFVLFPISKLRAWGFWLGEGVWG